MVRLPRARLFTLYSCFLHDFLIGILMRSSRFAHYTSLRPGSYRVSTTGMEREHNRHFHWLHPGNSMLRRAIQENIVSFPSQVPVLSKTVRPDLQWRVVVLYLVQGWQMTAVGIRFGLPVWRISAIIYEWSVRAFASGFIQVIDPQRFTELTRRPADEYASAAWPELGARRREQDLAIVGAR
jgi:hypothetical protein